MAKSYMEWDSPVLNDLDSVSNVLAFLDDFDKKMQESGLIKINSESTGFTLPTTAWNSNITGEYFEVMKLAYSFPKGKNKVEYENVAGQNYKKIKRASYSDTDSQILFKIFYVKATSSSGNTFPSSTYFTKTGMLIFESWSRNTNAGIWNKISTMGSKLVYNSGNNFEKGIEQVSRKNYIVQTEDTFTIYFGYVKYTFNTNDSVAFNRPNCLACFTLKRDSIAKGHSVIVAGDTRLTVGNGTASFKLYTCSFYNDKSVIIEFDYLRYNFFNVNFDEAQGNINGNTVLYPVTMVTNTYKTLHDAMYTTKYLPDNPLITDNNLIINYKNNPVMVGTVDFGFYNISFTYSYSTALRYGFTLIKTDFDIITGDLT